MSWHEQKEAALRGEYEYAYSHGNRNDITELETVMSGLPAARRDTHRQLSIHPSQTAPNAPFTRTNNSAHGGYRVPTARELQMELAPLQPNLRENDAGRLTDFLRGASKMQDMAWMDLPGGSARTAYAPRSKDSGRAPGALYEHYDRPPTHVREEMSNATEGGAGFFNSWTVWLLAAGGLVLYIMLKSNGKAPQQIGDHVRRIRDHFTGGRSQQYEHMPGSHNVHGEALPVHHNVHQGHAVAAPVHHGIGDLRAHVHDQTAALGGHGAAGPLVGVHEGIGSAL